MLITKVAGLLSLLITVTNKKNQKQFKKWSKKNNIERFIKPFRITFTTLGGIVSFLIFFIALLDFEQNRMNGQSILIAAIVPLLVCSFSLGFFYFNTRLFNQ